MALVPHGGNCAAVDEITEEAVAVGRHRNQIAVYPLGSLQNFIWRIAQRQVNLNAEAFLSKRRRSILQIASVRDHLFRFGQAQLFVVPAAHPSAT